jgi:tetratricopeptide (TPR) repeat protein
VERWLEPSRRSLGSLAEAVRANPLDRAAWSVLGEELALREKWTRLATFTREWQLRDPSNPEVYELIGEAALAAGDRLTAERAFGSLVETAAANPELVQRAGMLLFRMGSLELAESALQLARESRPDRVNGWRHLALVIWQAGRHREAAAILEEALETQFSARQLDVARVMRDELGYVFRDWMRVEPDMRSELTRRAAQKGVDLGRRDALRITLAWDTDANDVDLHVIDPSGEEVYFEHRMAKSGLELYEDVTRGFGPEVVRTDRLDGGTYQVGVNYYAVGPMGVSRGIVVVIRDDESGRPDVQVLPFRLRPEGESVMKVANLKW